MTEKHHRTIGETLTSPPVLATAILAAETVLPHQYRPFTLLDRVVDVVAVKVGDVYDAWVEANV